MARNENGPNLSFRDDPMFKRVMEREDICKGVIERIIGQPIGKVEYHNTEQERRLGPGARSVRMDSYLVESGGDVFDVEMQIEYNSLLPLRFRAYQSVLDGSFLKRGQDYSDLRESYIIFICMKDPFGEGLPVYTVERSCRESQSVRFDCDSHWMALNASAYGELGEDDDLGKLLEYVYTNRVSAGDALVESIDAEVARNNEDRGWIMTMIDSITIAEQEASIRGKLRGLEEGRAEGRELGLAEGRKEGREEGRKEGRKEGRAEGHGEGLEEGLKKGQVKGENRYAELVGKLIAENRIDDIKAANDDPAVRKELYREFGMED